MIFKPNSNEYNQIRTLKKFINNNYTIIRLTQTMINKNNIDANYFMRTLMKKLNIVDYTTLKNGGSNGKKYSTILYSKGEKKTTTINFYKVNGKRSDPRFSIYNIKKFNQKQMIKKGDLLVIIPYKNNNEIKIHIFNVSSNTVDKFNISQIFNVSKSQQLLDKLLPQIKTIARQGYHPNSKGTGKKDPKDAGDTLENLLNIKKNNRKNADINGLIELKSKTTSGLNTLFTLRPCFEGTPIAKIEPNDKKRVSAYTRKYGYLSSDKKEKQLYVTISNKPNRQGFYLKVNEKNNTVELRKKDKNSDFLTAYFDFQKLEKRLKIKHPLTLWFKVTTKTEKETVYFRYEKVTITQIPNFETFISLIKSGDITYDWRGKTTVTGKYKGKNHGNAWRINKNSRNQLFDISKSIDLIKK